MLMKKGLNGKVVFSVERQLAKLLRKRDEVFEEVVLEVCTVTGI